MYKVKSTGKNEAYGKKGEVKLCSNWHTPRAVQNGWVKVIDYAGSGEYDSLFSLRRRLLSVEQNIEILKIKESMLKREIEKKTRTGSFTVND